MLANFPWKLALAFIALYWAGGVLANELIVGVDSIVLLWAPGALSFVLLLHQGRRWWPLIGAAELTFSLTGTSVPSVFIPFTVMANIVGALAATTAARAMGFLPGSSFDISAVRGVAIAGLALALASLPFGLAGLIVADFTTIEGAPGAAAQWLMSNVFGVLVIAPALILLWPKASAEAAPHHTNSSRTECLVWTLALAGSLALMASFDGTDVRNAQALVAIPSIVLLWGALRLPTRWIAFGVLFCGIALAIVAVAEGGAFLPPMTTFETLLLLTLLISISLAPLVLMAVIGESQRIGAATLRMARTDDLTGLANRQGLEHRIGEALAQQPADEPMALVLLDIDNFKLVNDAGGQASGDELLRRIGSLLRARMSNGHILGRLAADQFLILLRRSDGAATGALLQELLAMIREYRHVAGDGVVSVSASIGAIGFRQGQAGYPELLRLADAACAMAKGLGGNRMRLTSFDVAHQAVAERTTALRWALRLDRALREDHFRIYCQSIVPLGADHDGLRHLEILVRMLDPETGELLPPAQFVAAAERFNMGARLDRHVIDRTLSWFERHPQALNRIGLCAINLCAASVNDPDFVDFLRERFARSSVPPEKVCLEITETSAVRDLDDAQQFIAATRALGCKLALDDFGAGFCSFAYLRRLDVDFFKIDGSFVRDLESSTLSLSIVQAIANIARSIDKRTIAEFVESDALRLRLAQIGVDFGQGYGIDRPTPIEQYFLRPPAAILRG